MNHYKGLTIADILGFCKGKKDFEKYLPDERDVPMLPRDYLLSLAISIVGEEFRQWVKEKVDGRHKEWVQKNDQAVEMTAEVKKAILACRKVSGKWLFESPVSHILFLIETSGRGVHFLKAGYKRRRTEAEMKDELDESEK